MTEGMTEGRTKSPEQVASEVNAILADILGLDAGTELDPSKQLDAMGVDSLLAMDLQVAVEAKFGVALAESARVDFPTILTLAAHIHERVANTPARLD